MKRRNFLGGLTMLPVLPHDLALAQIVPENDNRLDTARVSYDAAGTKIKRSNPNVRCAASAGSMPRSRTVHPCWLACAGGSLVESSFQ